MKKDLYYSLKVFSSVKFELNKAKLYENHYEIPIDQAEGGGAPNHDTFDMNPQIYFKAIEHSSEAFNCWLSYKVHEHETAVKVFVVRLDDPQIIPSLKTLKIMCERSERHVCRVSGRIMIVLRMQNAFFPQNGVP